MADSSFSGYLSQMGLLVNHILKSCPFVCQCPVSSPVTHHNWFVFSFNSSLVLLAEGICRKPFACLSHVKDSQDFWWALFVLSQTSFLAIPAEMLYAGSGGMKRHLDLSLANQWAVSLHSTLISVELCYIQPFCKGLMSVPN